VRLFLILWTLIGSMEALAADPTILGIAVRDCARMVTYPKRPPCESPAGYCPTPTPIGVDKMEACLGGLGLGRKICKHEQNRLVVCDAGATKKIFPEVQDGCKLVISMRSDYDGQDSILLKAIKRGGECKVRGQEFEELLRVNSAVRQKDGTWKLSEPKFGITLDKYFSTKNTVITSFFEVMPWIAEGVNQCHTKYYDDGHRPRVPVARHFGGSSDDAYDIAIVSSFRTTKEVTICGKTIKAGTSFGIDLNRRGMCKSDWPAGQIELSGFDPSLFPDIKLNEESKALNRSLHCVTDPNDKKPWTTCQCDVDYSDMRRD